jgi:hypothetical protein
MRKILFIPVLFAILLAMSNCDTEPKPEPERYRVIYHEYFPGIGTEIDDGEGITGEVPVDERLYAEGETIYILPSDLLKRDGYKIVFYLIPLINGSWTSPSPEGEFVVEAQDVNVYPAWLSLPNE